MKLSKEEQNLLNELHGIPKVHYPQIIKLLHQIKFDFILPEKQKSMNNDTKSKLKLSFVASQKVLKKLKTSLSDTVIEERQESL